MTKTVRKVFIYSLSLICLLALWQFLSFLLHSPLLLPSVGSVIVRLAELCTHSFFWQALYATLMRSLLAFGISVGISVIIGTCIGISPVFADFCALPLSIIKSTPVVSFILLALFWFSSSAVPVFVSILMTLPSITSSIASGIIHVDSKLCTMTNIYKFSSIQKLRYLYIPSVVPYFFSGASAALGISWKVVVAGEVLSLPRNSVGNALQTAKVHLETVDVFAWTIAVILVSFCTELLFNMLTKKGRAL